MIANIQFDSIEEMREFAKLIGGGCNCKEKVLNISAPIVETPKEEPKETRKKTSKKADKTENKKDQPKEDKKVETPKVEAEVTGVDETANNEPVQDVEDKKEDEGIKVTKEMLRAICAEVMKAGKQAEVKTVFENHGASKLPEVKEEDYAAVYKEVEALK